MGYRIKIQKVERPTNRSFYVNLTVVLAEAMNIKKGEAFDWIVEDKNILVLKRVKPLKISKKRRS